jgi:hypothetical protein
MIILAEKCRCLWTGNHFGYPDDRLNCEVALKSHLREDIDFF